MTIPWVEKYRPRSFAEIINQEETKHTLVSWMCAKYKL
jgi:replication factor C large subunit